MLTWARCWVSYAGKNSAKILNKLLNTEYGLAGECRIPGRCRHKENWHVFTGSSPGVHKRDWWQHKRLKKSSFIM